MGNLRSGRLEPPQRGSVKLIAFTVTAIFLFSGAASEVDEDDSIASVAKSYFDKAVKSVTGRLGKGQDEDPSGTEAEGEAAPAEEAAKLAVLSEAVKRIFHKEDDYHFTQSHWGAKSQPYQIEGLEVYPLDDAPTPPLDSQEGIEQQLTYEFRAKAHRLFDSEIGWGRWREGIPPHLGPITLVRQNGAWKVSVSPEWAYAVK